MIIVRPDDPEGDLEEEVDESLNKVVLLQEIKRNMTRMQRDLLSSVKASQANELTGVKSDMASFKSDIADMKSYIGKSEADIKSYIGKLDAKLDKILAGKE